VDLSIIMVADIATFCVFTPIILDFGYIFNLVGNGLTKCALVFYFMNGDKYQVVSFACLKNFVNYRPKLSHFNDLRQSHGLVLLTQWSEDLHGNLPQLLLVGIIW
jgi:hypothetical protein